MKSKHGPATRSSAPATHVFFKLKTALRGHPIGQVLRIPCDRNGIVTDVFWRRRINDSVNDNCLEVLKRTPKSGFLNA